MYREIMREIGDYIFVEDEPKEADIILIPGNGYPQMAEQAARLYRDGYAPVVLPSGKYSVTLGKFGGVLSESEKYTRDYSTEWEFLRDVLVHGGVKKRGYSEGRSCYFYLGKCQIFQRGHRQCRSGNKKSNFMLQKLSCTKSTYVL